ncbi:MAG: macro domain-containing protein [Candidatus Methanomethylophilaceae archaeon]|nr:macro domain-containing protein [Candidatus Methanomethylophilaceae archaeon]
MIKYIQGGDIFDSHADALVNPVNCKGVMGKGIALEFKKRFPEYFRIYRETCIQEKLRPGILLYVHLDVQPPLFENQQPAVVMFPTKDDWRKRSQLNWIEDGLQFLKNHYKQWNIKSIALPQLGCGLGGLDWENVEPLIEKYFEGEDLEVEVYLNAVTKYRERSKPEQVQDTTLQAFCQGCDCNEDTCEQRHPQSK